VSSSSTNMKTNNTRSRTVSTVSRTPSSYTCSIPTTAEMKSITMGMLKVSAIAK